MSTDRTTEILNYMSAMSRDFGEFRQEFKQHRQEFNQFREETNARLEKIEQRLDRIEERLDKVEQRLDKIEGRLDTAENEQRETWRLLNRVAGALLVFRSDIDDVHDRVRALERKQT